MESVPYKVFVVMSVCTFLVPPCAINRLYQRVDSINNCYSILSKKKGKNCIYKKAPAVRKEPMATVTSASPSPEKVSLASSPSSSTLGSAMDSISAKPSPQGSQQDLSMVHPGKVIVKPERSALTSRRTNSDSSCISLCVGGQDEDMTLNFNPRESVHKWRKLSSCEEFVGTKRSKHTIVAWNDRIYVFGGDNGRRMLNDFLVSQIHEFSWARVVYTGELKVIVRISCVTLYKHCYAA